MEKYSIFKNGFEETARITINVDGTREYLIGTDIAMRIATEEEMKDLVIRLKWCETSWSERLREEYRKFKELLSL